MTFKDPLSKKTLFRETLQNLSAELLRFAERLLVFDENPIQFQRLVCGQLVAQHHVTHVNGIRQRSIFRQLFEGSLWIVVVHHAILTLLRRARGNLKSRLLVPMQMVDFTQDG